MRIGYDGSPADWVADQGRPARCLCGEMPAYEDDDGRIILQEVLICNASYSGVRLLPRSYARACLLSEEGLSNIHIEGEPRWRPKIYWWKMHDVGTATFFGGWWQAQGSQSELALRYGLAKTLRGENPMDMDVADYRADDLLVEHLDPQQRIEYLATGNFRCRGGRTGNVYRVNVGDGFQLLDETDDAILVSYCLHTEYWIPNADQALATKLALEDPELEIEVLEGARMYPRDRERPRTHADEVASRLERGFRLVDAVRDVELPNAPREAATLLYDRRYELRGNETYEELVESGLDRKAALCVNAVLGMMEKAVWEDDPDEAMDAAVAADSIGRMAA